MSSGEATKAGTRGGEPLERPIRLCVVVDDDGGHTTHAFVCCSPRGDVFRDVVHCEGCPRLLSIASDPLGQPAWITCEVDGAPRSRETVDPTPIPALAEAPLREALGREHLAVRADLPVDIATAWLLGHGHHSVPVVDELDRVVGIVTTAELLAVYRGEVATSIAREHRSWWAMAFGHVERASAFTRIADVMRAPVSITDDASVGHAASIMASEGVDALPVVAPDGRLLGVITSREALRWVASGR